MAFIPVPIPGTSLTHVQMVNRVLTRLREQEVSSVASTTLSRLIGQFVDDAQQELYEEWTWSKLQNTFHVTVFSGQDFVSLTSSPGEIFSDFPPDADSMLVRDEGAPFCWLLDPMLGVSLEDYPQKHRMVELNETEYEYVRRLDPDKIADPEYFYLKPNRGDEELLMYFYPTPASTATFKMQFYNRPTLLETDGSTDDIPVSVPSRPLYELVLMYALNERGEEMGEPGNVAERRFRKALDAAMESDMNAGIHHDRYEWRRD